MNAPRRLAALVLLGVAATATAGTKVAVQGEPFQSKSGGYAIGNVELRGGGQYDSGDARRWRFEANDIGLDTRSMSGEYSDQGRFKINFGYDELLKYRSDSFQTPYNGAGGTTFTLPANWLQPVIPGSGTSSGSNHQSNFSYRGFIPGIGSAPYIDTRTTSGTIGQVISPNAAQIAATNAAAAADVSDYHHVDLKTKRTKYDGGLSFDIDNQWNLQASFRREDKKGLRAQGVVSEQVAEYSTILPMPVDTTTDQYNLSLSYKGDKSFAKVAYYASMFKNNITSVTWQDANNPGTTQTFATMGSEPGNHFHQLSVTGGYFFTPTTKLVVDASYARNTQNDQFLTGDQTGSVLTSNVPLGVPRSSLDGLVVSKQFAMKLTAKPTKDWSLAAAYKFDLRDNRTPVDTYVFRDANEPASGTALFTYGGLTTAQLGSRINIYSNRPYSKRNNAVDLDADYKITDGQAVKLGYDYEKIDRWCNGTWIDCVDADSTKENTLRAEYRATMAESVTGRVSYAYSKRTVDNYNENAFLALVPMANQVPTGATMSAYQYMLANNLTGFGPVAPYAATAGNANILFPLNNTLANSAYASRNIISELIGMRRFNMADRNRDKLRTSVNWQATEKLSLQAGADYDKDDYKNSTYGLQNAKNWALNLDASYTLSDDLSLTGFLSHEDQRSSTASDNYGSNSNTANVNNAANTVVSGGCYAAVQALNNNAKDDPCRQWSSKQHDKTDTLGLGFKQKGLMGSRLELAGDLVFSWSRTDVTMGGGGYYNNPYALAGVAPAVSTAVYYIPAADLPEVSTDTVTLRVTGKYTVDKQSAVRVGYSYSRLKARDYAYDAYQIGGVGTVSSLMPTAEQVPGYSVQAVGVSYVYEFK